MRGRSIDIFEVVTTLALVLMAMAMLLLLPGCPPQPRCPPTCPPGQECVDPLLGCRPIACPEECPEGQECVDPAKGCEPKPVKYAELAISACPDDPTEFCQQGKRMDFGGCIVCCLGWEGGWDAWPMFSPELAAYLRAQGDCKRLHARPGPFLAADEYWPGAQGARMPLRWKAQGIGGPYIEVNGKADLTRFNPAFWSYNERAQDDIGAHGMTSEIDSIDGWRLKNGCPYSPWNAARNIQGEDHCALKPGDPVQDAWIRQLVLTYGRFANKTWQVSNEPPGPRAEVAAWEKWVVERTRFWEMQVRVSSMIATNSGVAEASFDYVNRHDLVPQPIAGKPSSCNEINPAPVNYPLEYCRTEHLWAWRAELPLAQWEAALAGIREVRQKGCAPKPTCTLGTPTAREAKAQGKDPTINVQRTTAGYGIDPQAGKWISGTPIASFGRAYYCAIGWTEACNEGKTRGPVAPEGHPQRMACEAQFLEQPCPTFSMDHCTGTGEQCPITWDTYIVIGGVNQLHPTNVAAGCRESTYVRNPEGRIVSGEWWKATAHGKGYLKACNADGSVCGVSSFEVDQ